MARLTQSALALGLLGALAPLPALAHDHDNEHSGATVIQYDPHSSEDIYESPGGGQYQARRGDRDRGRHRGWSRRGYKKDRYSHRDYRYDDHNRDYGYRDYGYRYDRYGRTSVIYRQPGLPSGCILTRGGTVCR